MGNTCRVSYPRAPPYRDTVALLLQRWNEKEGIPVGSRRLRVSWAFKASREAEDLGHSLDGGAVNP